MKASNFNPWLVFEGEVKTVDGIISVHTGDTICAAIIGFTVEE